MSACALLVLMWLGFERYDSRERLRWRRGAVVGYKWKKPTRLDGRLAE